MEKRTRRSPARFLGPLALIAVLVAFLAIVTSSGENSGSSTNDSATTPASRTTTTDKTTSTQTKKKATTVTARKTYTVQVGDTLGGIADKTGVPLQTIEELNPDVDPHAMTAGQEIKLR
jgi:LysM repeat protein